jgi:hypothetical protein
MNSSILTNIANWCLGDNKYTSDDILNNQHLKILTIQILNNKCFINNEERLSSGKMEQRQYSICKMIEAICSKYKLPNVVFSYYTPDRTNDINGCFFTHARLKGIKTRNILAPCFTFYGYPEKTPEIITKYTNTYKSLIKNKIQWKNKKNSIIFVGTLTDNNYRKINTQINCSSKIETLINDQGADSLNFLNREYLCNFKYLLHLNGNGGAYASRLKYLLGAGGLVLYNCNSGEETNMWEEWWMQDNIFKNDQHYILCSNLNETCDKLNWLIDNENEAKRIANNAFTFFKQVLTQHNIEKFWVSLLNEYKNRCLFEITEPIGNLFQENLYGD